MKRISFITIIIFLIPVFCFGQLKKDLQKPNISNVLNTTFQNNAFFGLLDPSKMEMRHSVSMSYMNFGNSNLMLNTYINTINYRFNDKWQLTTKLGIMNSPINSLPNSEFLNNSQLFGGAELNYFPSENTRFSIKFESVPYLYSPSYYYSTNPFRRFDDEW